MYTKGIHICCLLIVRKDLSSITTISRNKKKENSDCIGWFYLNKIHENSQNFFDEDPRLTLRTYKFIPSRRIKRMIYNL